MNASSFPKPAQRVPAVIYTTATGKQGICPVHHLFNRDELIASYRNSPGVVRIEEAFVDQPGWRNPNAMDLGVNNRDFDRQAYLITGNVIGSTMLGFFVRPRSETACNNLTFAPGHLQSFDLKTFENKALHAKRMLDFIRRDPRFETQTCQAYVIFHLRGEKHVVHGALVTDTKDQLIQLFQRFDLGLHSLATSAHVMAKARHFLTDERISDRKTIWTLH